MRGTVPKTVYKRCLKRESSALNLNSPYGQHGLNQLTA